MKRMTWNVLGALSCVAVLAAAACSKEDTTGTPTGSPTGSATGTTTGTGTGTGTGTSTGTETCPNQCYSCGAYAVACASACPEGNPVDLLCPQSLEASVALNTCLCDPERGACDVLCAYTCSLTVGGSGGAGGAGGSGGAPVDDPTCHECMATQVTSGACTAEMGVCAEDTLCPGP